jgi:hypothetical protein
MHVSSIITCGENEGNSETTSCVNDHPGRNPNLEVISIPSTTRKCLKAYNGRHERILDGRNMFVRSENVSRPQERLLSVNKFANY